MRLSIKLSGENANKVFSLFDKKRDSEYIKIKKSKLKKLFKKAIEINKHENK